jgi:hypothetical protein
MRERARHSQAFLMNLVWSSLSFTLFRRYSFDKVAILLLLASQGIRLLVLARYIVTLRPVRAA